MRCSSPHSATLFWCDTRSVATFLLLVSLGVLQAAEISDPSSHRGGPQRQASDGSPAPRNLVVTWRAGLTLDHDGGVFSDDLALFLSSPLVHQGWVYAATTTLDVPNNLGAIICLDAASGTRRWSLDAVEGSPLRGIVSSPVLSKDGNYLVIGEGLHMDEHSRVICLDPSTGKVRWSRRLETHIEATPCISGDLVIACAGAIEDSVTRQAQGSIGEVVALSLQTGAVQWRHPVVDPEFTVTPDGDGFLAVSCLNGQALLALDAAGKERWKVDLPASASTPVSLSDELMVVGSGTCDFVRRPARPQGAIHAFNNAGELRWQTALDDTPFGPLAIADGTVVAGLLSGHLVCLDATTGAKRWDTQISVNAAILGGVAITEQTVYAVTDTDVVVVIDLLSGKIRERHALALPQRRDQAGRGWSGPVVAQGAVFVATAHGGLVRLDARKRTGNSSGSQ